MNKQAIRDSFVGYALEVEGEHGETWWSLPDHVVNKFVEAIAQDHEEEVGKLRDKVELWHSLQVAQYDEATRLEAQVAVMAELIEEMSTQRAPLYELLANGDAWHDWYKRLKVALQSAPKVLYHKQAEISLVGGTSGWTGLYCDNGGLIGNLLGVLDIRLEGQRVDVIILEGPNALQEQSKATMPDKECSVNDGRQPKGKQEEPCGTQ